MAEKVRITHTADSTGRECWICKKSATRSESLGKRHKPRYLCEYHWNLTYSQR